MVCITCRIILLGQFQGFVPFQLLCLPVIMWMKLKEKLSKFFSKWLFLCPCMWHSAFKSAVTSQQENGWHLVSTKDGSSVQPNTRKSRITSHLRNILGKFLESMIMIIFRYCLCEFPNDAVSKIVLHSLAQKIFFLVAKA